ncbi:MAG: hypothetical protein ABI946_02030 [Chthoniobacterales bacterium]
MSADFCLIVPEIEAGVGGLADYTLRLVEEWPPLDHLRFLVPQGAGTGRSHAGSYPIEEFARNAGALRKRLPAGDGKVLLQYSAYGFDRHGFPRWLLRALRDWKRERAGRRLVIMFHEIWTFWPWWNKNWIVQQLHRREIAKLLSVADAAFTSTASQAEHLRDLHPSSAIEVLPVASGVRLLAAAGTQRQTGVAVLFGLQSGRLRALRSMAGDLSALAAAGQLRKIVTVGGGNQPRGDEQENALLTSLRLPSGFEQRGFVSEIEISALLAASAFGISAQDELSLTKSSTFMAYAAHEMNVLSRAADPAADEPFSCLISAAEIKLDLGEEELRQRAKRLRDWQERTASWRHIAARFAAGLQIEMVTS